MNNFEITARLTKDPEIKYTATGVAVANFSVAENIYNKKEKTQEAQFHNVVAFGKTAELIGNTLAKGNKIHISGTIKNKIYLKDDERKKYTEIVLRAFEYCEKKVTNA